MRCSRWLIVCNVSNTLMTFSTLQEFNLSRNGLNLWYTSDPLKALIYHLAIQARCTHLTTICPNVSHKPMQSLSHSRLDFQYCCIILCINPLLLSCLNDYQSLLSYAVKTYVTGLSLSMFLQTQVLFSLALYSLPFVCMYITRCYTHIMSGM